MTFDPEQETAPTKLRTTRQGRSTLWFSGDYQRAAQHTQGAQPGIITVLRLWNQRCGSSLSQSKFHLGLSGAAEHESPTISLL